MALASRAFGNILAHATVDVSEGALHKEEISGVRFVRYKDERAVYYVSFEEAQKRDLEIGNVLSYMNDMKRLLPYRYPRPKKNEKSSNAPRAEPSRRFLTGLPHLFASHFSPVERALQG